MRILHCNSSSSNGILLLLLDEGDVCNFFDEDVEDESSLTLPWTTI